MEKKFITVVTPSYNRENLLPRLYESLCRQTSKNFCWILVDDGSRDGTKDLVQGWIDTQKEFDIKYLYKENGGMYSACRMGVENTETEAVMDVDSDDWIPDDAIEKIEKYWNEIRDTEYIGLVGYDSHAGDVEVKGLKFDPSVKDIYIYETKAVYKSIGDKKYIHRTEIIKETFKSDPFPIKGEKYFNPMYAANKTYIYGKYKVIDDCFCIIEYQQDGLSRNKLKQFYQSPNNYGEMRRLSLSYPTGRFPFFFRESIHYVSCYALAGKLNRAMKESPRKFITLMSFPFGLLFAAFIKYKNRK